MLRRRKRLLRVDHDSRVWIKPDKISTVVLRNRCGPEVARQLYSDLDNDVTGYPVHIRRLSKWTGYFYVDINIDCSLLVHDNEVIRE